MSFKDSAPISDSNYISENNIKIDDVAKDLTDAINKQIFEFGFFNSNLNEKNIFVRNDVDFFGRKHLKLIFLDNTVYRSLDRNFRYNYLNLWRGIILKDSEVVETSCNNLGIQKVDKFMPILTSFTYYDLMKKSKKYSKYPQISNLIIEFLIRLVGQKEKGVIEKFLNIYHKDISEALSCVSIEMLLLLRINQIMREINQKLTDNYIFIENTVRKKLFIINKLQV